MKFTKIECGVPLDGNTNACFFLSLKEGLRRIGHPACRGGYDFFLSLGEWSEEQRGEMVDTYYHVGNIFLLAESLGVRIVIYAEEVDSHGGGLGSVIGTSGPYITIIKLRTFEHFNFMDITSDDTGISVFGAITDPDITVPKDVVPMPKKWAAKKTYEGLAAYRKSLEGYLKDSSLTVYHSGYRKQLAMSDDELLKVLPPPSKIYRDC
jgi:hypothetical protein